MMERGMLSLKIVWGLLALLLQGNVAVGQVPVSTTPPVAVPATADPDATENGFASETVQARLMKVQEATDRDPAVKQRLIDSYQKTLDALKARAAAQARLDRYSLQVKDAPQQLQLAQKELSDPLPPIPLELPQDSTLAQGQQRLSSAESSLADLQRALQSWQDETKRRTDRRAEILKQQDAIKTELAEIERLLTVPPVADEPDDVREASRWVLESRRAALTREADALQAETRYFEASVDILPLQRDLAARKVAQAEEFAKRLREMINERRRIDAEMQARETRRVVRQVHPALRSIADRNAELAKARQELALRIEATASELEAIDDRVEQIDSQFSKLKKRVEMGQRNGSIGLLLRKQRDELPNPAAERSKIAERAERISETSLNLVDYEDERNALADLEGRVAKVVADLEKESVPEESRDLELSVREMLQTQRGLLDSMISDSNSYVDKLVEQDVHQQDLINKTIQFAQFCDERILWIRSTQWYDPREISEWIAEGRAVVSLQNLQTLVSTSLREILRYLAAAIALTMGWLVLVLNHYRFKHQLQKLGEQASSGACRTIDITLNALLYTLLLASPVPVLLALLGWLWSEANDGNPYIASLGWASLISSAAYLALEFMRQLCRSRGLAEAHFNWDSRSIRSIRFLVAHLKYIALPLLTVITFSEAQPDEIFKNAWGRLAFVVLHLYLLWPAYIMMHPHESVLSPIYQREPNAWWSRLKWLWFSTAMGTPLAFVVLSVTGFHYTAVQLSARMLMTAWLVVGLVVAYGLLLRWSLVAYRTLGMQRLQERRANATAAAVQVATPSGPAPVPAVAGTNAQLEIRLTDINQQTRQTLQLTLAVALIVGVWWIWFAVVPALGALRHINLWTHSVASGPNNELVATPVTLADLLVSVVVLTFTMTVGRNIPSLLELTILKRLPLDAGGRYAVATIVKYVVVAVGIIVGFSRLGFEWSQVQWLVAGISVGLGFGLQEIFANFVSGLVLLFERPIRIGDTVTVGDVTGKVTNIRMRAATITDGDLRDLIVPNKELITGRVINWTLSTTVSRMSINVGVKHGVDPNMVRQILLDVANLHPLVLKDPAPHALLDEFTDSTLSFVLRVHMSTRDIYIQLRHELLTQINYRFDAAGIEFAFPQLEIHDNGEFRLMSARDGKGAAQTVN